MVSFFGLAVIIKESVRTLGEKEIGEANKAAVRATVAADEGTKQALIYARTVETLQNRANLVDADFINIQQKFTAEIANAKADAAREAKDITTRLERLDKLVAALTKKSQMTDQVVGKYRDEIEKLQKDASDTEKQFAENSGYYVNVYHTERTKPLSINVVEKKLTQAGFKVIEGVPMPTTDPPAERTVGVTTNQIIVYDKASDMKAKEIAELLRPIQFSFIRSREERSTVPVRVLRWETIKSRGESMRQQIAVIVAQGA